MRRQECYTESIERREVKRALFRKYVENSGTLRISSLIDHRKYKSVITRQAQLALRRVPLNCLRI